MSQIGTHQFINLYLRPDFFGLVAAFFSSLNAVKLVEKEALKTGVDWIVCFLNNDNMVDINNVFLN